MSAALLRGLHILVVEDHGDTREMIASVLRQQGARVTTAASAQTALLLFETEPPDLLVSDLEMGDVDGLELMRKVRALPPERGGRIPAVAVTVHTEPDSRIRALKAGFQLHMGKPVDPLQLATLLAALHESSRKS
jgi:CheY-like chemotaxis protein